MVEEVHGTRVLTLSHSLVEVAAGRVKAKTLRSDLRIGGGEDLWFGSVADVAVLPDGRFAVFDRMEKQILLFDAAGSPVRRIGREGDGPGEFKAPWALEAVGGVLVAWQDSPSRTFTVFDTTGKVVATSGAAVPGGWHRLAYRQPTTRVYGPRDQRGPEDVTRRLVALGDSGFVHLIQFNELDSLDIRNPRSFPSPPAHLIRYGLDATVRDTLATVSGTATEAWLPAPVPGGYPLYAQPLYSGRPVWTIGDGWYAVGHGDSSSISVRWFAGAPDLVVRLPGERTEITFDDRIHGAKWLNAHQALNSSWSRNLLETASAKGIEEGMREDARNNPFARYAPTVTALFGYANCLFASGFSPSDWHDGTSMVLVVIDVERGAIDDVIRLPRPAGTPMPLDRHGAAVVEIAHGYAFTTYRDYDGVFFVERVPLPDLSCDDGAKRSP